MPAREIDIQIAPDGTVRATVSGIKGPACQELAKELAHIIGQELSFAPSAEFYECEEHRDVDIEDQSRT